MNFVRMTDSARSEDFAEPTGKLRPDSGAGFFEELAGALDGESKPSENGGLVSFESVDISQFLNYLGVAPEDIPSMADCRDGCEEMSLGQLSQLLSVISELMAAGEAAGGDNQFSENLKNPEFLSKLMNIIGKAMDGSASDNEILARLQAILGDGATIDGIEIPTINELKMAANNRRNIHFGEKSTSETGEVVKLQGNAINQEFLSKLMNIINQGEVSHSDRNSAAAFQFAENQTAVDSKNIRQMIEIIVKNFNKQTDGESASKATLGEQLGRLSEFEGASLRMFIRKNSAKTENVKSDNIYINSADNQSAKSGEGIAGIFRENSQKSDAANILRMDKKISQSGQTIAINPSGESGGKSMDGNNQKEFSLMDFAGNLVKNFSKANKNAIENGQNPEKTRLFQNIRLAEIGKSISNLARTAPANSTSTARLVLRPESLGTVFVEITMDGNLARLNIKADSREAVKSIESQIAALKEKLSQSGIRTDSVDVRQRSGEGDYSKDGQSGQHAQSDRDQRRTRKEYLNWFAAGSQNGEADPEQH